MSSAPASVVKKRPLTGVSGSSAQRYGLRWRRGIGQRQPQRHCTCQRQQHRRGEVVRVRLPWPKLDRAQRHQHERRQRQQRRHDVAAIAHLPRRLADIPDGLYQIPHAKAGLRRQHAQQAEHDQNEYAQRRTLLTDLQRKQQTHQREYEIEKFR
jgi:hypothetical protein